MLIVGTYVFPEVFPALEGVFAPGAKVVHVDLDAYEIAKNFPVDLGLVADPKLTLGAARRRARADAHRRAARGGRRGAPATSASRSSSELDAHEARDARVRRRHADAPVASFMAELARQVPDDVVIFDEALTVLARADPPPAAERCRATTSRRAAARSASASPARSASSSRMPDKTVIGFSGDGGAMYTIQAMWTAAHHGIGAKFVVCNNRSYQLLKLNVQQYWRERGFADHALPRLVRPRRPGDPLRRARREHGRPGRARRDARRGRARDRARRSPRTARS